MVNVLYVKANSKQGNESKSTQLESPEYSRSYLKTIMAFMGIKNVMSAITEGLDFYVNKQEEIIQNVKKHWKALVKCSNILHDLTL